MWLLRTAVEFTAKAVWKTAWFAWNRILVPTAKGFKRVLRDGIAKKIIRAPLSWTGKTLWAGVQYLGNKWRSAVTKSAWAVKNVLTNGTAKTSALATTVGWKIADTLKATTNIPGKIRNGVVKESEIALDLLFNFPDKLAKTPPVQAGKEARDIFFNLPDYLWGKPSPTP
jgi:hypothetical protein